MVPPWVANPYDLVSWEAMERFSARGFYLIGRALENLVFTLVMAPYEDLPFMNPSLLNETINDKARNGSIRCLRYVDKYCEFIGLLISAETARELCEELQTKSWSYSTLLQKIQSLKALISKEMKNRTFMYIPVERAALYDQNELFGKKVNSKFPSIQFDATEAGTCYACGRSTAVVFHLMRIMETGVQAFGTNLGVALADEKNWQNILDEINKKIKALPPKHRDTIKMSQAAANLYAVKLTWRNEVMHPKDTYTLEEAENLIRQVKLFMEHLATIV